jgi:Helix-turn-helix domain
MTRPEEDEVLTIQGVMRIAKLSETTALRWVGGKIPKAPYLPAVRIGRSWRIRKSDLLKAIGSGSPAG